MKQAYVKPMVKRIDFSYDEQITAASNSFVGKIGSMNEELNLCQFGVTAEGITTCKEYFHDTESGFCNTDQYPMSLRPTV